MRKYRSWLMGLGIGLIVGATMLQVILMAKEQSVMTADQSLTREQLDDEAKKSGLVLLTAAQLEARVNEAVTAALEQQAPIDPKRIDDTRGAVNLSQEKTNDADQSPSPSETASNLESAGSADQRDVQFYIRNKMTLSEVASKLQELGIIDEVDDFVTKAWPISKKLSVGTAILNKKMTYKQIMAELTRVKLD